MSKENLKGIILGTVLVIGLNYASAAWSNPTSAPTGGNPDVPVNVGSVSQTKNGSLILANQISNVGDAYLGTASTAKVGIGNSSPRVRLDVSGEIATNRRLTLDQTTPSITRTWHLDNSAGRFRIFEQPTITTSGSERLTILTGGNVGIGTANPTSLLTIGGTNPQVSFEEDVNHFLAFDIDRPNDLSSSISVDISRSLVFGEKTNPSDTSLAAEHMRISDTGNVGIGLSNPSEKLDVSGNIKATSFLYSSDESLKKDITSLADSYKNLSKLKGVSFTWKESGKKGMGFIAQDLEKVFPELVTTDPNTGLKSVDYAGLIAPLLETVKGQQEEIERMKEEIENLKERIE